MIDPFVSLVISMASSKGTYALLVGSGISRSAGIPTGWEIVEDLIRKIAIANGEDCGIEPVEWYSQKFGNSPSYSSLLEILAKTPAQRNQLLRSYFEPSLTEKEQGLKVPSAAHKAIAKLVAQGFLRIIITTNFDRLLEKAIEEEGVTPFVISNHHAAMGAIPISHGQCIVIKVNGDYLESSMKNTIGELTDYEKPMKALIDRVFDEFGLVVCGWSGEWDIALKKRLESCKSYRFPTFWTLRESVSGVTTELIKFRRADLIKINDADQFFVELETKTSAINEQNMVHPATVEVAVAALKKLVVDNSKRVQLHDFLMKEAGYLCEKIISNKFSPDSPQGTIDGKFRSEILRRTEIYEQLTEVLISEMAVCGYWCERDQVTLLREIIELVAAQEFLRSTVSCWVELRYYPAILLFYSAGVLMIANEKFESLLYLFSNLEINTHDMKKEKGLKILNPGKDFSGLLPGVERKFTPLSERINEVLKKPIMKSVLLNENKFDSYFDKFEYFLNLVFLNEYETATGRPWAPLGMFAWRERYDLNQSLVEKMPAEAKRMQNDWPPLKAGFFGGSVSNFLETNEKLKTIIGARIH